MAIAEEFAQGPTLAHAATKELAHIAVNDGVAAAQLGPIARDVVTRWAMQGKGRALWCVGEQQYKVATVLHPSEAQLTFTNDAIAGAA